MAECPYKIIFSGADNELRRSLTQELALDDECAASLAADNKETQGLLQANNFCAAVINSTDTRIDAIDLVKILKRREPDCIPIILMSGNNTGAINEFMRLGVYEFVIAPFDIHQVIFLIRKCCQQHKYAKANRKAVDGLKEHNDSLLKQNALLAQRIEDSSRNLTRLYEDLRSTYLRTIRALAQAMDARDHYTHSHSENVARYAIAIAAELKLSAKDIECLSEACQLHDLGKIGIEDSILTKPAPLNSQEWERIKRHPQMAAQILEPLTFLGKAIDLIRQHHEHFDGSGYPEGIKGENIILGARIINVADAYEAMTSARSYRKTPFSKDEAARELKKESGRQFDPRIVNAFLKVADKL